MVYRNSLYFMLCRARSCVIPAGFALALVGCVRDPDDFATKAASHICAYNEQNPDEPFLNRTMPVEQSNSVTPEYEPYGGASCEQDVIANLVACEDTCEYKPRKGRRCLRKLKRAVKDGHYDEGTLAVCERVYECPEAVDRPQECAISTRGCRVGGGHPALAVLFAFGLWGRRRRR